MRSPVYALVLLTAAVLSNKPALQAAELLSGPMVGHTTTTSAKIWIETDVPASVEVSYWLDPQQNYERYLGEPLERGAAEGRTSSSAPHTGVVQLEDLNPGWLVYYELEIDGRPVRPQTPQAFSLMPPETLSGKPPNQLAEFSVATASCMYPAHLPIQPIWDQLARHRPNALLLLGDNNYMPLLPGAYDTSEEVVRFAMARSHRYLRDVAGLRTLLATTPTYGIWNDHDYGPNDSDRTFRWRDLSLSLFKRYFPNPSAGLPDVSGIFTSFRIADAEFFMLDDRYYRDPNHAPDRKQMLGPDQLRWLRSRLKNSTATFKVIVSGGTLLVDRQTPGEHWANFGDERNTFLTWLSQEGITGVLVVAGDWHIGSLNRLYRGHDSYPLYELISSNAGFETAFSRGTSSKDRFHQFAQKEYRGYNFGLLRFAGAKGNRTVSLQVIDQAGKAQIDLRLREQHLTPEWKLFGLSGQAR